MKQWIITEEGIKQAAKAIIHTNDIRSFPATVEKMIKANCEPIPRIKHKDWCCYFWLDRKNNTQACCCTKGWWWHFWHCGRQR